MKLLADKGLGDPLVMVCALMCDAELFAWQIERLKRSRRVLVFQSEGEESMDAAAQELLGMLAAIGLRRVDLAGLSMGGYISLALLAMHPGVIRSLILMDTRAEADSEEGRQGRLDTIRRIEDGHMEAVIDDLLPKLLAPANLAELGPRVRSMMRRLGPDCFRRQLAMMLTRRDTRGALEAYDGPALVLCGARDELTPPELHRDMAGRLKAGRLAIVPGDTGHLSTLEAPEAVLQRIRDFLEGL